MVVSAPRVALFIGARPNLPKAATVVRAFAAAPLRAIGARLRVVHTGQHADRRMGLGYAETLGVSVDEVLRAPAAGRDGARLAGLVASVDAALAPAPPPDLGIVVGDVNSTVAAALVLARLGVPVAHVEAGIRSNVDEPEEVNRKVVTAVARYHLTPSRRASENLRRENVPDSQAFFVGNAHTETFLRGADRRARSRVLDPLGLEPGRYVLLSVHKTPTMAQLGWLADLVGALAPTGRLVWVVHPTTRAVLDRRVPHLLREPSVHYVGPLPYDGFGRLLASAGCVVTDSAGMQEETTVVGVPCVTVGVNTARPETIVHGSNSFAGFDVDTAVTAAERALSRRLDYPVPDRWDTAVSDRIGQVLAVLLAETAQRARRSVTPEPKVS